MLIASPFAYPEQPRSARARFEKQLPDTLVPARELVARRLLAHAGSRGGRAGDRRPDAEELQRVFTEVRLGRPIEDALGDAADRMDSNDLAWTVMAIRIQREVGGNLAVLLDTVADTMVKRERIRRELRSLTAEGRLSAIVLSCFPPVLARDLVVLQPDYLKPLFHDVIGIIGLVGGAILSVVGWFWLRRIVDIEV